MAMTDTAVSRHAVLTLIEILGASTRVLQLKNIIELEAHFISYDSEENTKAMSIISAPHFYQRLYVVVLVAFSGTAMAEDVPADEMRVLLATDLHLGYCERDPVRENDSFETLEEILTIAKEKHVDAVFIAGDMFHENKPSRKTMYRVSEILRRYVFGDERCSLRMASNNADHFRRSDANITFPNFDDDGLEVTLPIFAIHGNHDDPAGDGALSALDVLAATGLINYIGRVNDPTDIKIEPVVLVKGERRQMTVLSLYGLGNMRDERVHKAFTMNQLRFERTQSKGDVEPYNLLMIHQNRVAHAAAAFVPDNMLPDMFHLVLWVRTVVVMMMVMHRDMSMIHILMLILVV